MKILMSKSEKNTVKTFYRDEKRYMENVMKLLFEPDPHVV
jgi:hypothetical protein